MKKISLITTTKDRPEMLKDAAISVVCQSVKPYEWIVVIDGDDRPYEEAIAYLKTMPFVKVICAGNLGRNWALRMAHELVAGDYIAWLDDDDWLHHTCLEKFNDAPDVDFLYCDYYQVRSDRLLLAPHANKPYSYDLFIRTGMICHLAMYTKHLYDFVEGIDSEIKACIDTELYARMLKETKPCKINEHLYYYRIHHPRMSTVLRKEQQKQFKLIQETHG